MCAGSATSARSFTRDSLCSLRMQRWVLRHSVVTGVAARANATPAQVVFAFARLVGMLPLTGTSSAEHMKQDLASSGLALSADAVRAIEDLAG